MPIYMTAKTSLLPIKHQLEWSNWNLMSIHAETKPMTMHPPPSRRLITHLSGWEERYKYRCIGLLTFKLLDYRPT